MRKISRIWTLIFVLLVSLLGTNALVSADEATSSSNLAAGRPVTFSGVEGGKTNGVWKYPQFTGEKVVDENLDTRWSADKQDEQWIIVDLESAYDIDTIKIVFHAESPVYDVEISTDGTNYTKVLEETLGSQGAKKTVNINIEGQKARYIAYRQHKQWKHATNNQFYGSSIIEISVSEYKEVEVSPYKHIRLGSFNIAANLKPNVQDMQDLTNRYKLDLVGLQEVDRFTGRNNYDMLEAFSNNLYDHSYYSKAINYSGGEYGIGLVSKFPLNNSSRVSLPTSGSEETRVYQRSVIEKDGYQIAIYNTHLSPESMTTRHQQFEILKNAMDNETIEHIVLMGDFNADQSHSEFYYFMDEYNLTNGRNNTWYDTFIGTDASMLVKSVDNIIVSRNLEIISSEMIESTLSDHNLWIAELKILDAKEVSTQLLDIYISTAQDLLQEDISPKSRHDINTLLGEITSSISTLNQLEINTYVGTLSQVLDNAEFYNLALNKDVTYSGVEGDKVGGNWKYPQFVGEKAVDGDLDSRWSAAKLDSQWLIVDLKSNRNIGDIFIEFHAESPDYEILVSQDGSTWTQVYKQDQGSQGDKVSVGIELDNVMARYVKYQQNKQWKHATNKQFYGSSIIEFEVYESFIMDSIELNITKDSISVGDTLNLVPTISPLKASYKNLIWSSSDPTIVSVDQNGIVRALSEGSAQISVTNKEGTVSTTAEIKAVVGEIKIESLILEDSLSLYDHESRFIDYDVYPSKSVNKEAMVEWSVEDESIVTISETGLLSAHKVGTTRIKLSLKEDASIYTYMDIIVTKEMVSDDYHIMSARWLNRVVGTDTMDVTDPDIAAYIKVIEENATTAINTMNRNSDRSEIWDKIPSDTVAANYTTQMTKIKNLALAFGVKGSKYYQDKDVYQDIVDSLYFMIDVKKYNGSYSTGNWWDWQIGATQPMVDTLFIIQPYTDIDTMTYFVQPINGYAKRPSQQWPSYTATGANRTDIGLSVLGSAILLRDEARLNTVVQDVPDVMKQVTSGDGLYADGGIIQHSTHAYLGSYGNELVKGVGRIMTIMDGTQWEITDSRINNVYNSISEGYIPLMYKGKMMSMVNGRSISRAPGTNPFTTEFEAGSETISNVMLVAKFAPVSYKNQFNAATKSWLEYSIEEYKFYENARDFESLLDAKAIMNNDSISNEVHYSGMKIYGSMDRAVQINDTYTAALSTYSSRVSNYEYGNTENKHGWHTGSGVLYIYNDDLPQYGEGHWPTIDPYHLPGTTVDTRPLADGAAQTKRSNQSWVGGVQNQNIGAYGMYYSASSLGVGMNLTAQKSWFFLEGSIVALGTNITGTSTHSIDTTIENKEIYNDNIVTVNGAPLDLSTQQNLDLPESSWVHLEGNTKETDTGYYFFKDTSISAQVESNTGRYQDINEYFFNDEIYTKEYFKMIQSHGQNPNNDTYAYAIVPGASKEDMASFSESSSIEILANTNDIHAIKTKDSFMMNVWKDSSTTLNDYTVSKAASLVAKKELETITISLSDPRQQTSSITLSIGYPYEAVVSKDNSVVDNGDGSFTFNVSGSKGASHELVIKVAVDKSELLQKINAANTIDTTTLTAYSLNIFTQTMTEANEVLSDINATQLEVNNMVTILNTMIESLDTKIDLSSAQNLLIHIDTLFETEYTVSSWNALHTAYTQLQALVDSYNPELALTFTQDDLDTKVTEVQLLVVNLELKPIDTSLLQDTINKGQTLLDSHTLTEYSQNKLAQAISEATSIINTSNVDQDTIDTAYSTLLNIISTLDTSLDLEYANSLISLVNSLNKDEYTDTSWNKLQETITKLKNLLDSYNPSELLEMSQEDIDVSSEAVEQSLSELIRIDGELETSDLKAAINKAKSYQKEKYTSESYQKLEEAIKDAQALLDQMETNTRLRAVPKQITQEDIDLHIKRINDAIAGLEEIKSENPGSSGNTQNNSKLPSTGISSDYLSYLILVLGFITLYTKRKSKQA